MKASKNFAQVGLLFSLLVLTACSGGSGGETVVVPPPPTIKAPTITASYSHDTIPFGEITTITWSLTTDQNDSNIHVYLNSSEVSGTSFTTPNLYENTDYTLKVSSKAGANSVSFTILVGEEKVPTLDVTITPDAMPYPYHTNSVTVSWNTTDATKVTVNGVDSEDLNGSEVYQSMVKDTTVVIIATNVNKTVTVSKTLTVGDWTTSSWGIINHSYWNRTEYYFISHDPVNGDITHTVDLDDEDKAEQWVFEDDGSISFYNPDGTSSGETLAHWSLDADATHFTWGSDVYTIVELNQDSFRISRDITWDSMPTTEYYFFERTF